MTEYNIYIHYSTIRVNQTKREQEKIKKTICIYKLSFADLIYDTLKMSFHRQGKRVNIFWNNII